jgi:signal transduction histidine kinase
MTNRKPEPTSRFYRLHGAINTGIALFMAISAVLVLVVAIFQAVRWLNLPFFGAFTDNGLVLNDARPAQPGNWQMASQGPLDDLILASVDGLPIALSADLQQYLAARQVGETILIEAQHPTTAEKIAFTVTLQAFPAADLLTYFLLPYLLGLLSLGVGLWIFFFRRRDATGKTFLTFTAIIAILVSGRFDSYTTHALTYLWTLALSLVGGVLINMGLSFPEDEGEALQSHPFLRWIFYLPGLAIFAYTAFVLFDPTQPSRYALGWNLGYGVAILGFLFMIARMAFRVWRSESPVVKNQSRLILLGGLAAMLVLVVLVVFDLAGLIHSAFPLSLIGIFSLLIFIATTAYAIARHRLVQADFLMTQLVLYVALTILAAGGFALVISGLTLILRDIVDLSSPYIFGIILFVLAIAVQPLRERLQSVLNGVFGRNQVSYRDKLQAFGRQLTEAVDETAILKLLRDEINQVLAPVNLHIFLFDILTEQYIAASDTHGRRTSDLYFSVGSALVRKLSNQRSAVFLSETKTLPATLQPDKARLAVLGARVFIPMPGRNRLAGWIALGNRRSDESYSDRDLSYLEGLADQAALAIERAQVVTDLERRVHAMNVLTRISQGVNVTVAFDDILELIYAQTNFVIPTVDFRITLWDSFSNYLYYVFYLENDDRLTERENIPIPLNQGLDREILRTRRSITTEDYERECRGRGLLPTANGLWSWMGVPLNTGSETIGVISLGSRDASTVYTEDQVSLLQAIADQAAGAIVKARLLQEAERRARQLTTLNEVARSLSSTLELAPLFTQILKSAVDILNCESGSLLLIDRDTDELIFEAAVGPVAGELIGRRLPPGSGVVGKAVETRHPQIVNDVRRTKDWYEGSDQQTGYSTNDLLAVPMIFKDEVTGVVEVINRKDGLPFSQDDQELLSAFSSQAAIALENARLFNMTDQALANRVEELSVMQRIDRELNASLDVNRAMRLTLDWAMRQARSRAGLVGMVEEGNLRIVAHQGFSAELEAYQERLPLDLPNFHEALVNGQSQLHVVNGNGRGSVFLKGANEQLVVPIRREDHTIGLLVLESREKGAISDDTISFLNRLMDHASIAITNARLYTEVQSANRAKSEFVSFVAHELKNPMTSIRGFADLLASGVVGPINENQTNFLQTIRSNVERMATLVTDLADVSRIEAGRLRLDFAPVSAFDVVDEVIRSLAEQIKDKHQILRLDVSKDLPPIWGDKVRLIQVVLNLASNAHKYSPENSDIYVRAALEKNIWFDGSPQVIHFYVRDSGFGISPENQKHIFEKFYRADDQKVRDAPGTGLGLNITKQLVELQGGRIWFESVYREGTTFHVVIPIVETA